MLKSAVDKLRKEISDLGFIKNPGYNFWVKSTADDFYGFTFEVNPKAREFGEYLKTKTNPKNGEIKFEKIIQEHGEHKAEIYAVSFLPYMNNLKPIDLESLLIETVNSITHEIRNYKIQNR